MKLSEINFKRVAQAELSEDDRAVLHVIYRSRLRTWLAVFASIIGLLLFRSTPYFLSKDPMTVAGAITATCLIGVIPAAIYFRKCVWAYRQDLKCGFKYVVYEEVIGKRYFPYTNQYFLSLSDAAYLHHEVDDTVYSTTNVGDRYPVYFAACSRYPFTLRARFTAM